MWALQRILEREIEANRMLNDLGWERMAAIAERTNADIRSDTQPAPDPPLPWNAVSSPTYAPFHRPKNKAQSLPGFYRGSITSRSRVKLSPSQHPRWEPDAGMPHVRFCTGGAQ